MSQRCPNHAWTGACMSPARRGVRAALGLHGRLPPCGDTPGLCASREDTAQCSRTGKRLRPAAGGAQLPPQTALSEDGYDADVKKPVADPTRWKVPSGKVWVTSKLQVTRSPCTLALDEMSVSVMVSPPVGVNSKVRSKACGMKTAVLPTTWAGLNSPLPLTTTWTVCPSSQVAGNVRLFLALIGSAAAPWARATSIRIPKVSATHRRLSMQAPPSPDLVMSSPVSIWPDACQRLSGRRAMHRQGHANPTLSVRTVDATVSSSHVSFRVPDRPHDLPSRCCSADGRGVREPALRRRPRHALGGSPG